MAKPGINRSGVSAVAMADGFACSPAVIGAGRAPC
jgi:hypothetical protein